MVPRKMWLIWKMKRFTKDRQQSGVSNYYSSNGKPQLEKPRRKSGDGHKVQEELVEVAEAQFAALALGERRALVLVEQELRGEHPRRRLDDQSVVLHVEAGRLVVGEKLKLLKSCV